MLDRTPDHPQTVATNTSRLSRLSSFLGTIPGSISLGEHGPEFRPDPPSPVEAEAILACGHRLLFTVPPITGERLYCLRCTTWEKCVVPGGYLVKCESCKRPWVESHFGHDSTLAKARARTHAIGKGNRKRTTPHVVSIGRYTEDSVTWSPFEKE